MGADGGIGATVDPVARIAIVCDSEHDPDEFQPLLRDLGKYVVELCSPDPQAISNCFSSSPDIVVVLQTKPQVLEVVTAIAEERNACVGIVAVGVGAFEGHLDTFAKADVVLAPQDPLSPELKLALLMGCYAARRRRALQAKIYELESRHEDSRLINRAVELLADQRCLPLREARSYLRHEARNRRQPMADVARVIVDACQLLNSKS